MDKLEACIFDLDGVVVDTAKYHYVAWKELGSRLGVDFTHAHNENLKGVSRINSLKYLLSLGNIRLSDSEMNDLMIEKNKIYLEFVDKLTQKDVLPGVLELLVELRENNIKIAIGSASKNARHVLSKLEITNYFDHIVDGNDTVKSKPDPEVFLTASDKLQTKHVVVFEDAPKGVDAARAANFFTVGIGDVESLRDADHVISSFENFTLNKLLDIYKVPV